MRKVEYDVRLGVVIREGDDTKTVLPAAEIIRLVDDESTIMKLLEDVPGANPVERVRRLKEWYQDLQEIVNKQILRATDVVHRTED